jgi:hypothetical protein
VARTTLQSSWYVLKKVNLDRDENAGKDPGQRNDGIMQTREERRGELKRLAARPNGSDRLYAILTRNFIPFEKLPIGTLMIEAILNHEYSENKSDMEVPGLQEPQKPGTTCPPPPG